MLQRPLPRARLSSLAPVTPVTCVVSNARIWTGIKNQPLADSIALAGDTIVAIGAAPDVKEEVKRIGVAQSGASFINPGQDALIFPGFTDAHLHLPQGGMRMNELDLSECTSMTQFLDAIKTHEPQRGWIIGGGWDENQWDGQMPNRSLIDTVAPNTPVCLHRMDGHCLIANTSALKEAGVVSEDGILREKDMEKLTSKIPPLPRNQQLAALKRGIQYLSSHGITSVHQMCLDWSDMSLISALRENHDDNMRVYTAGPLSEWRRYIDTMPKSDKWFKYGAVKGFADGSLGSRTAAFFDNDAVDMVADQKTEIVAASAAGLQVCMHAIGDRAINSVLNVYSECERRRHRIEHAQHPIPSDVERFHDLGVIASMQPSQIASDANLAPKLLGDDKWSQAYPLKSLAKSVCFGSDWPVSNPSVIQSITAAVGHGLDMDTALHACTTAPAYASHDEGIKGCLAPGMLADFVVVRDGCVETTVVGGNIVFDM